MLKSQSKCPLLRISERAALGQQEKGQQQRRLRNHSKIYLKQIAQVKKEILCNKTKNTRAHTRTSVATVDHFLFRTRTRTNVTCILALVINHTCVDNITLRSLVRKKFSRYLTSMITIVTKSMLDQAQLEHIIKVVLHCEVILLRSFLAHPDHIDNIPRMKQADHRIETMSQ